MADKTDESEIMTAITAFEQILEAMPNDRASLEALSHAYAQIGDLSRAKDNLIKLGEVMLEEGDAQGAGNLLEKLNQYAAEDPRAKEIAVKIVKLAGESESAASATEPSGATSEADVVVSGFSMADELSFAWNLMESNHLTQEEYSKVVQDLTEMSAGEGEGTISVLHVLEAMGFKGLDKILATISTESNAPVVSLASHDLYFDAVKCLPLPFMKSRGAVAFELLGGDALVVVMNPFDVNLRKDVESLAKRGCHFYMCMPVEFDKAIEKAGELIAADADHEMT